ncbi:MAG: alanine-tRNA synthetase second additional domain-containing protein [Treponema sp.]|nr:alanine-tRNA synthetase second additional domain-containing protein [Treponema sp.]
MRNIIHAVAFYSVYFAPRGRERLLFLGEQISQRHLTFSDRLIGVIGDAGSGKSSLIKGMFPGLELVNDDDRFDSHRVMHIMDYEDSMNETTTFHLDMRFQVAFTQMHEIVRFVKDALENDRRVIIEHFDLLYPALKMNAQIMIGIGEEIIVTRPGMFGPLPKDIYDIVHRSLKYRKMVHTAEDITAMLLTRKYNMTNRWQHSDVKRGFVLIFNEKPDLDIGELEADVKEIIDRHIDVAYFDDRHIKLGDFPPFGCSGPRIHLNNTKEIEDFRFSKDLTYDRLNGTYALVGLLGKDSRDIDNLNKPHFL